MLDCAIIGGGPAGLTAGLYTTRGGLKNVVMFEMGLPGGQITQSSEIENIQGFFKKEKVGMDFMGQLGKEQCFGIWDLKTIGYGKGVEKGFQRRRGKAFWNFLLRKGIGKAHLV